MLPKQLMSTLLFAASARQQTSGPGQPGPLPGQPPGPEQPVEPFDPPAPSYEDDPPVTPIDDPPPDERA